MTFITKNLHFGVRPHPPEVDRLDSKVDSVSFHLAAIPP